MNPQQLIRQAEADGLVLVVTPAGTVKLRGSGEAIGRWLPILRGHKPEILAALTGKTETELRRLVGLVAMANSRYWSEADVAEAVEIGMTDADNAIQTFASIARGYGLEP